ncbi:hypothetical protein GO730_01430 [Spirosoma sp. HMF3257]|uniref:SprB repeat-containing protein n=1 Tax=Spirosoma telluris TaxID=2183553 RepID=A0A327NF73_9BACT|nr:hypothetical protein [Spirosoma telluris]RAI73423.1 hypothetical protein HMF3257_01400 [Spirosoma telluris]
MVTDKAGCTTQASYTLTQPTQLQAQFTVVKAVSCASGSDGIVSVDVSGGTPKPSRDPYSYSWKVKSSGLVVTQGTNRLTNASSTTYVVTATDGNGVSRDFEIFLPEPLPLVATVASLTNVSCFGLANGSASVTIQGGAAPYVTRWSTQQTGLSLANMQAGKYLAVITDANSCQAQVSVQIQQPRPNDCYGNGYSYLL